MARAHRVLGRAARGLLALGVLSMAKSAAALPPGRTALRTYGSEQGLLNANVVGIAEDNEGYLWVGTQDGIYRYDGQRLEHFGTQNGLLSDFTSLVCVAKSGRLWVGTLKGAAYWEDGHFVSLGPAQSTPTEHVAYIVEQPKTHEMWVTMKTLPLLVGDERGFHPKEGWPGGVATALASSVDPERMWTAATVHSGDHQSYVIRSHRAGVWREWPIGDDFAEGGIEALAEDPRGRLWIRLNTQLWRLDSTDAAPRVVFDSIPAPNLSAKLIVDSHGRLLIPSGQGFHRVKDDKLESLGETYHPALPWSYTAFEDREGSLWIGGLGLGLNRVLGRGVWQSWSKSEGLPSDLVWAILYDKEDRLWAGTQTGLAVSTDAGWKHFEETKAHQIIGLVETPGAVWAAGKPKSLFRYDRAKNQVDKLENIDAIQGDYVVSLAYHEGRLWIGSTKGLSSLDPARPAVPAVREPLPVEDSKTFRLEAGPTGRLWASTSNGLAVRDHGRWHVFGAKEGLRTSDAYSSIELADGTVLTTSADRHGVGHFRYQSPGKLEPLRRPDGTRASDDSRVYNILQDRKGRTWIGTGRGLFMRTAEGEEEYFGLRDGLSSEDFSPSAIEDPRGNIWFATSGGIVRFDTEEYKGPLTPPPVTIRSAWLGSQRLDSAPGTSSKPPDRAHAFKIRFVAHTFVGEGRLEYQTRLEGFDADWQSATDTEVLYAALPAGSYEFQARARVTPGRWGESARLSFHIFPRWYETLWFKLAVGLSVAGLAAVVVRVRVRALEKKNLLLEQLVSERTREVATANDELKVANGNMRLVLDTVDQGLVMLDARGGLTNERSAAFDDWFGKARSGEHFAGRIAEGDNEASLRLNYEQMMEGNLPVELGVEQMPKELHRDGNHYTLSYKPVVRDDGHIETTLLTVSDVTSEVEARRADATQRQKLRTFERIVRDRPGFAGFFGEAGALLERVEKDDFVDMGERLRVIHTIKGNAALFDAASVSDAAHELEGALLEGEPEIAERKRERLVAAWREYAEHIAPLMGDHLGERVELTEEELDYLVDLARGNPELERTLHALRGGEPLRLRLARIEDQVKSLSARLGKGEPQVILHGRDLWLPSEPYAVFWSSFTHVLRNAVDHGFQTVEERRAAGKPDENRLEVSIAADARWLLVEIADDGRGVDWERVSARAAAAGLPHRTRADLVAALCHPGFSTAEKVTEYSGRGVGMSAVAEACRAIGGTFTLSSEKGKGTRLCFTLPLFLPEMPAEAGSGVHRAWGS